ncbi:MAG: DNA polymerase III subunit alpha [Bacillota bacterium]
MAPFVHLHVHSPFSFLDGASSIRDLVETAAALGMPALAITDHHHVSGGVKFFQAAQSAGIKPIQGAEITLSSGYHLVLLAQDAAGYANLCRILTDAHLSSPRRDPRVNMDTLELYHHGLIALSACRRGEIPSLLLQGRLQEAEEAALRYRQIFGAEGFYIEMQRLHLPWERPLNRLLKELASRLKLKTVATNNVHYTRKEDFPIHDLLTCVRTLTRLADIHPERRLNAENYLKPAEEMAELFKDNMEALTSTMAIAERCQPVFQPGQRLYPAFPLPPGASGPAYLSQMVFRGARERYPILTPSIVSRLEHELDIINRLGYADYFLLVWDVVNYAKSQGIRYAGRGSAADSAVAYCLQITEVDPISRRLLFERFMSLERAEKPDIDIDFDARYRDRIAQYVYQKYGLGHVASVATYNTFRARGAVRDLGKAMDLPEETLHRLAKLLPYHTRADGINRALTDLPELRANPLPPDLPCQQLLAACEKVAGFPRFLGTHLGGLVVSRAPLLSITPLQEAAKGVTVIQFDKEDVEALGLVKLDLLSLRTMSAIEDAVLAIREEQPDFNYEEIPLADKATYQMLNKGETVGVFQLESPAQRALQSRLQAAGMEDIVASLALIRPGPIKGNMVEPFVARRQGKEPVSYLLPQLQPILEKTYGVVLFQEQVIEIATAVAGFTPGEADRLRRVMTHARSQREMEEIGQQFIAKAVANGIAPQAAQTVFSYIKGYASYGFCEAHAAAFATTAYKTAYLINHFPAQFFAALFNHQPVGFYPPNTLAVEARRRGINILPPDINLSGQAFAIEGQAIRVSLRQVKGIKKASVEAIIKGREEGPFVSLADLCQRVSLPLDELESLINCGALDSLHPNRRQMLWLLRKLDRPSVNTPLNGPAISASLPMPEITDFSPAEKRAQEYRLLGLEVDCHEMALYREDLNRCGFTSSKGLGGCPAGKTVKTAGIIVRPHRPPTRSGKRVVFMSLQDEYGLADITVFEDVYQQYGQYIFTVSPQPVAVEGTVSRRRQAVSITARRLWPLKDLK